MTSFATKITQFLDSQDVNYTLLPHQSAAVSVEDAAKQRGIRTSQMVKSMLLRDMGGMIALACCPGNRSVDPKKVRKILDCRRMTCVEKEQVESLTGYKVGTVAPLLLKRHMPILFDHSIKNEDCITISSGDRLAGIALHREDLTKLCTPIWADICKM